MSQSETLLFNLLFYLPYSIAYAWSLHHFCISHFQCTKQNRKLFLLLLSISIPIINAVCLDAAFPFTVKILLPLLWQIMLISCVLLFYQGAPVQKISAISFLLTVSTLLQHFVSSFLCCLIVITLHLLNIERISLINFVLESFTCYITFACVIWSILFVTKHMTNFFADRLPRWHVMLSVPLLVLTLIWDFIDIGASHGILLRGGDHLNPYYNEIFSYIGLCVLSILCICGVLFYIFGMGRIDIEQKQKEQYHSQVVFYQMLEEQYNNLERLRHDMKNHIIGLQRLIDNHDWDKMTDYLNRMADTGNIRHADNMTGKNIVDALLYYKHKQAKAAYIRWECDIHLPLECSIADFDLCVIFGNLLDNALEACTKKPDQIENRTDKFIKINAHMVKKCLLLEIVNSVGDKAAIHEKTLKYSTSAYYHNASEQATNTHHLRYKDGIGLRNVKDTIRKYNGTLHIDVNDSVFQVLILLPCIPDTHNINQAL